MNVISQQLQRFNLDEAFVVNFALYPMPNFTDDLIREKFDQLINELETIPEFSMGTDGTVLWIRDFADVGSFALFFCQIQKNFFLFLDFYYKKHKIVNFKFRTADE